MTTKSASAVWSGDLKTGKGEISTESGVLNAAPYGFRTRFEGMRGTNPEELIGAAHAGCFSMALSNELGKAGITPERIETTSDVALEQEGEGFTITDAHLTVKVTAPGADRAAVEKAANDAKDGCPVSKVLNADITMDATYEV
jgi:osmotically inducible protein OsmC